MKTTKEIKQAIRSECYPVSCDKIPDLTRQGKLPKTAFHLESAGCDFRAQSAWRTAYYELKEMRCMDLYSL